MYPPVMVRIVPTVMRAQTRRDFNSGEIKRRAVIAIKRVAPMVPYFIQSMGGL